MVFYKTVVIYQSTCEEGGTKFKRTVISLGKITKLPVFAMLFLCMLVSSEQRTTHLPTFQVGLNFLDMFLVFLLRLIGFPLLPVASKVHLETELLAVKEPDKYFYKSILRLRAR